MNKEIGSADSIFKMILATVAGVLYLTCVLQTRQAISSLVLSALIILTSYAGFCPLYVPIRFETSEGLLSE